MVGSGKALKKINKKGKKKTVKLKVILVNILKTTNSKRRLQSERCAFLSFFSFSRKVSVVRRRPAEGQLLVFLAGRKNKKSLRVAVTTRVDGRTNWINKFGVEFNSVRTMLRVF